MDEDSTSRRLKLLQDISSSSGLLPESYWVLDVTKGRRISSGGEATVYIGRHRDRAVVVREFHPVDPSEGNRGAPNNLAKVCQPDLICCVQSSTFGSPYQIIIREVISHWQLRHPNIVALIGVCQFDEEFFPSVVLHHAEHPSAVKYLESHTGPESFVKIVRTCLISL